MSRPKPDKHVLLTALASHVLENGLNDASLRPMAAAAGTSDRMLIYHFGSKDGLIGELLEHLAAEMAVGLDEAMPPRVAESEGALVLQSIELMRSEQFKPYVRVWLDIVSSSAQGRRAHRQAGHKIIDVYLEWIALRHPKGKAGAPFVLTLIEGVLVMDAVGQGEVADAALSGLVSSD